MSEITFVAKMKPISLNNYYVNRAFGGVVKRFVSKRGKEWAKEFKGYFPKEAKKISGHVEVHIYITTKYKREFDVDNAQKMILDCIKDILIEDDLNVYSITCTKKLGDLQDAICVTIFPYK